MKRPTENRQYIVLGFPLRDVLPFVRDAAFHRECTAPACPHHVGIAVRINSVAPPIALGVNSMLHGLARVSLSAAVANYDARGVSLEQTPCERWDDGVYVYGCDNSVYDALASSVNGIEHLSTHAPGADAEGEAAMYTAATVASLVRAYRDSADDVADQLLSTTSPSRGLACVHLYPDRLRTLRAGGVAVYDTHKEMHALAAVYASASKM